MLQLVNKVQIVGMLVIFGSPAAAWDPFVEQFAIFLLPANNSSALISLNRRIVIENLVGDLEVFVKRLIIFNPLQHFDRSFAPLLRTII